MGIDTQTMEQTFAQYGRTIYRLALQYTRQPPDAEDVLQEVLLSAAAERSPSSRRNTSGGGCCGWR